MHFKRGLVKGLESHTNSHFSLMYEVFLCLETIKFNLYVDDL
jgi:hypothetical protein